MGCFRFSRSSSTKNKSEGSSSNIKNESKSDDHKQSNPDTSNIVNQQLDLKETTPGNEEIKEVITSPSSKNASVEDSSPESSQAQTFSYQEMADATKNFKPSCLLGEGGFGKVYKGRLQRTNEVVAIKQLDRNGAQGMREFVVEVLTLGLADHPNLVKLIGYCTEGDQRMLVYEFMPLGSLESHIHDLKPNQPALDWNTRMKIAAGAAMGLEYLHDKMNPPIIYRDLKCSNILLGQDYHPKLSDFGLAKVGPAGDNTHVSTRVMGTYGYCAPDYAMTGQLTFKSDIYSFGVVLLELITGRKAIDYTRTRHEQNLVAWARPLFKDRKRFWEMADPAMKGQFPTRGLYQALAIAAMCLQEQPNLRPLVGDVVTALNYLATHKYASVRSMSIPGIKSDGDSSRSHNSEHIPTED